MFVDTLDELSWMDETSKKKAQEKVGKPQPARYPRAVPVILVVVAGAGTGAMPGLF